MELIADGLQGFIDWYITEEADIKTNKNIWRLKVNIFQELYEMAQIIDKGFDLAARGLRISCRKPVRA
jgi:hypothetical protein